MRFGLTASGNVCLSIDLVSPWGPMSRHHAEGATSFITGNRGIRQVMACFSPSCPIGPEVVERLTGPFLVAGYREFVRID